MIRIRTSRIRGLLPESGRSFSTCAILTGGFAALALAAAAGGQEGVAHSYVPKRGFVPDSITAVRVAEAVLDAAYGTTQIDAQKPLRVTLSRGVWTVMGTLPRLTPGGVAEVRIARQDGRILRMTHGR